MVAGVIASARTSPHNKAAILPGEAYPIEPSIPGNATVAQVAWYLNGVGFTPDPAYRLPWTNEPSIFYGGGRYRWTGSHWIQGTAMVSNPVSAPFGVQPNSNSGNPVMLMIPAADWPAALLKVWTANPTSAWATGQTVMLAGLLVRWNGTAWEIVSAPSVPATKPLTGGWYASDTQITAQDATNAAKIAPAGFNPVLSQKPWRTPASSHGMGTLSFVNWASAAVLNFYWDGAAWQPGTAPTTATSVALSANIADAVIAALPASERIAAITMAGYRAASPTVAWTTGQSATIAGVQVHWRFPAGYWSPGAVP